MYARDFALIATPIGTIAIAGSDAQVERIRIGPADTGRSVASADAVRQAVQQLEEWFDGSRRVFDLRLAPAATGRGEALRQGMIAIGYGETRSYGALARSIASSARAIGQACARNPFPIVVPCHRVLNAGGALGAYSAGDGPATKFWLLEHERRHAGVTLL